VGKMAVGDPVMPNSLSFEMKESEIGIEIAEGEKC
jgi:hypothetical protein